MNKMGTFYDEHKELIDQAAHFIVGALLTYVLCFALAWIWSFLIMIGCAVIRELIQHRKKLWKFIAEFPHAPFPLGNGSLFDLIFFMIGGIMSLILPI